MAGLAPGTYDIEWWDTTTGDPLAHTTGEVNPARHTNYGIELTIPDFRGDIAVRIVRK